MIRFCLNNEITNAKGLLYKLLPGLDLLFEENNPAGVKAFLAEMGVIQNQLRLPLLPLSQPVHKKVKSFIEELVA